MTVIAITGDKSISSLKQENKILITQPRPKSERSPYFDLEKKYDITLVFHSFLRIEGLTAKEFRKQKIDITTFTAVIFTSRNAIDHFFRLCEEMKITIGQDTKYFCITEAVALYLQKFILYRKRKVFYGADGSNKSLLEVIIKHKNNENFLYISSEHHEENDIINGMKAGKCTYNHAFLYRTLNDRVKETLTETKFDIICLFTPGGVRAIKESYPGFEQGDIRIAAFGNNTRKAAEEAGFKVQITAPDPQNPNMAAALDHYLNSISVASLK